MIENSRLYNSLRNIFYGILKYTISFIFPFIIRTIMIKKFGSGIVIASIGIIICPFISFFISGSYPRDINIYFLFLMFLANTVLSYVFYGYKSALLVANQRIDTELLYICNCYYFWYNN